MATARVLPVIPLLPQLIREIEGFETDSIDFKSNLRNHFLAFIDWLMGKLEIEQDKPSGELRWIIPKSGSPAEVLERHLLDAERLYSELYLIRVARRYSEASLSTRAHSIRLCYRLLYENGRSPIDPKRLINPRSFKGNALPISEYWLASQKLAPKVAIAERHRLSQFLRSAASHWNLSYRLHFRFIRGERRAFECLLADGYRAIEGDLLGETLTANICRNAADAVQVFFSELATEPEATAQTVKDRVSTVRRFVAWLNEQRFAEVCLENISNPYGQGRTRVVTAQPKKRKAPKSARPAVRAKLVAPPASAPRKLQRREFILRPSETVSAFRRLRNDLITALLRVTPKEVPLAAIADLRIRHLSIPDETIVIPVPHARSYVLKLDSTLLSLAIGYFAQLASGPQKTLFEANGDDGRLFYSLDGGTLLVDDAAPVAGVSEESLRRLETVRNSAMAAIVRTTTLGFGHMVIFNFEHASDWNCLRFKSQGGSQRYDLSTEAAAEFRLYGQFIRATQPFRLIWDSDIKNPLFLARDGCRVTADELA